MEESKKIDIMGKTNRYAVKNLIQGYKKEKEVKKRVVSEKWVFEKECYEYTYQLNVLKNILKNVYELTFQDNDVVKIIIQEIKKKIYSYKQQDLLKNHFDEINFLTFETVVTKLVECGLKCRYCDCEMFVLYDMSREMKQWSVDRIDNDIGHNNTNFHLACLDCNLKRRRRTDEKFLFTKKLNLVKQEN
jgi:hypothetical protein